MSIPMKVIGTLESCFRRKFGTPRQGHLVPTSTAKLKIKAEFLPEHSLKGLEEFSHVWLLFHFHLNTNKTFRCKIHPPRLRGKTIGVFASRSPHRPSPIGLTLARLERIEGDTLYLSNVDLIDGAPILDVKPYILACDHAPDASSGWIGRHPPPELKVEFSPSALRDLGGLGPQGKGLKTLISETLRSDPRNVRDRSQMKEGKDLALILNDCDIHFEVRDGAAVVLTIASLL